MKKVILVVLIAAVAFHFYGGEESGLVGSWEANGSKIVQSKIDGGKSYTSTQKDQLVSTFSDTTLIFTKNTMAMSFKSDPSFKASPLTYETISTDNLSVTISYKVEADKYNQDTYFFTEDGDCIYTKQKNYNDYFCKKI